jgi:hypothetical protein
MLPEVTLFATSVPAIEGAASIWGRPPNQDSGGRGVCGIGRAEDTGSSAALKMTAKTYNGKDKQWQGQTTAKQASADTRIKTDGSHSSEEDGLASLDARSSPETETR